MAPSELRKATLRELRAARKAMLSARWALSLEAADEETRAEAARELVRVNHAIIKLENEQLSEIRDALVENENDLIASTESLQKTLENVGQVKKVLGAVSDVLGVVGRVVALL